MMSLNKQQSLILPTDIEVFECLRRVRSSTPLEGALVAGNLLTRLVKIAQPFGNEFAFIYAWNGITWDAVVIRGLASQKYSHVDLNTVIAWIICVVEKSLTQPF